MSTRNFDDDAVFRALADPRRRRILDLLRAEPRTTGAICAEFPEINRCTVMQHLGVLEQAGLVMVKREGRLRWNYIDPLPIREIHQRWIGDYADNAIGILAKMKRAMEG